jgi:hypothetical protein
MQIKNRRPVQIVSVLFALTLFATYVVYSQLHRSRDMAPSSKSMAIPDLAERAGTGSHPNTNDGAIPRMIAPGSKSMAPIIEVRPDVLIIQPKQSRTPNSPTMTVAPGSKWDRIFDFRQAQQSQKPKPGRLASAPEATNTTAAPRPAP